MDINSSRQSFNCPELLDADYAHLLDATWALFAHERLGNYDQRFGLFDARNPLAAKPLAERVAASAAIGKAIDPWNPDAVQHLLPR